MVNYDVKLHASTWNLLFNLFYRLPHVRSLAVSGVAAPCRKRKQAGGRTRIREVMDVWVVGPSLGLVQSQGVGRWRYPPIGSIQVEGSCSSSWLSLVKTQISWYLWGGWISQWFVSFLP